MLRTLKVYTKKLNKTSYHMATFNEPLCPADSQVQNLPQHIIEEPAAIMTKADAGIGGGVAGGSGTNQYANVHQMVRAQQAQTAARDQDYTDLGLRSARANLPSKNKPVLVYEQEAVHNE